MSRFRRAVEIESARVRHDLFEANPSVDLGCTVCPADADHPARGTTIHTFSVGATYRYSFASAGPFGAAHAAGDFDARCRADLPQSAKAEQIPC
ncbi:hypothetical protein [Methylobacterium radiotolerans]|uniref:hypothetical protein n=1 Tax=Methylobacterium radiotolerans TaxID=31998 RepID=UPI00158F4836|nr:hypothetical protein [Methylobacterium radiotolerans]MCX4196444.1 hypothetical protein [Methylobacterium organophilum]